MKYLAEFILMIPVNVAMAWWHSRLIIAGRRIEHGLWAGLFSLLLAGAIWWQWDNLVYGFRIAAFAVACLAGRLPVFNIALNLFRGKAWDYMSPTSTAMIDKLSIRLFGGHAWVLWTAAGTVAIILQFFI